jgi:hypothetical protein
MHIKTIFVVATLGAFSAIGCGSSSGGGGPTIPQPTTAKITGWIDPGSRGISHGWALAISPSERTYVAPLDARGAFTLSVPASGSYRVLVADRRAGALHVMGHVILATATGKKSFIALQEAPVTALGQLTAYCDVDDAGYAEASSDDGGAASDDGGVASDDGGADSGAAGDDGGVASDDGGADGSATDDGGATGDDGGAIVDDAGDNDGGVVCGDGDRDDIELTAEFGDRCHGGDDDGPHHGGQHCEDEH